MKYDVIVLGAGNGGLVAALTLQKHGKRVLVLEANNTPGGFATSFIRGRFEFDASLHELCGFGDESNHGEVYDLFKRLGVLDKVNMVRVPESYHVVTINTHEEYTMPSSIPDFIQKMEEYVPGSTESVQKFFDLALEMKRAFVLLKKKQMDELAKECPHFLAIGNSSLEEVYDQLKMPKKAREIMSVYWVYLGSPSKDLSFFHFAMMLHSYISYGAYLPSMRSHELSLTLQEEFEALDGKICFLSKVEKILYSDDHISGVQCSDGSVFYANHIISNISPNQVYGSLIPKEKQTKEMIQICNARTLGGRGFCIYLGLNTSPEELGLKHYSYFIYDSLDSNIEAKRMKELYHHGCVASVLENAILSNHHTTTLCITSLLFGDDFDKVVTLDNYYTLKEKIASHFIQVFETATGSSIRENIEEIEVATPVTFARYGGHPSGTIYGYLAKGYDNLLPRLLHEENEQYVEGLRFCGGFGSRLSGFSSTYLNGEDVALKTLEDMAKGGEY